MDRIIDQFLHTISHFMLLRLIVKGIFSRSLAPTLVLRAFARKLSVKTALLRESIKCISVTRYSNQFLHLVSKKVKSVVLIFLTQMTRVFLFFLP